MFTFLTKNRSLPHSIVFACQLLNRLQDLFTYSLFIRKRSLDKLCVLALDLVSSVSLLLQGSLQILVLPHQIGHFSLNVPICRTVPLLQFVPANSGNIIQLLIPIPIDITTTTINTT